MAKQRLAIIKSVNPIAPKKRTKKEKGEKEKKERETDGSII